MRHHGPAAACAPAGPSAAPRRAPGAQAAATAADPPHRRLFVLATAVWLAAALWWALTLAAAAAGLALPAPVLPPGAAHALSMTLGAMPLYFAGFLASALPRWLRVPGLAGRALRGPAWLAAAGWALWWPLLHTAPGAAAAALLPVLAGQALLLARLARSCRGADPDAGPHARLALAGCALCGAWLALAAAATAAQAWPWLAAANALALWCGVAPVFVVAGQRLSPWLGQRALPQLLPALAAAGLLAAADALGRPPAAPLRALAALVLLAAAARLAWGLRGAALPHGQRVPMLRLLRAATGWLALALALAGTGQALQAALAAAAAAPWALPAAQALGRAATHALALGFAGGHWLAMVSRVTAVQAGQAQAVTPALWWLHRGLQALAGARVLLALGGAFAPAAQAGTALAAVAAGWAALLAAWAALHGRWLRPGLGTGRRGGASSASPPPPPPLP